ncbi:MAG TPA: hypothetical protein VM940_13475 [Chthoniobacterales bacterium]|nr:hypothetical protein [Chthoniobacterales bacterium]
MAEPSEVSGKERIVLDAQHPWPSLHAFTQQHHAFFRGRTRETGELVRRIRREVLTVLFGVSGLGKTSLLQAGVFPALTQSDYVPILIRLDHEAADVDVVGQVKAAVARELTLRAPGAGPSFPAGESLWGIFHRRDAGLLRRGEQHLQVVLVFDQFEEIFTRWLGSPEAESNRRHFLSELASLVENRPPEELKTRLERDASIVSNYDFASENCRIVISLREDFLPHLEDLKARLPSIMDNRFRLSPMDQEQALEAILGPGGEIVEEPVAREIISFLSARPDDDPQPQAQQGRIEIDPALLSLICSELNAQRIAEKLPRITSELLHGRSHRILDEFYLRCFEFLPETQREAARAFVEDRLLTPAGHRGILAMETARAELGAAGVDREAIPQLVHRRLLQVDERHRLERVELAHDVLTKVVTQHRDRRHERIAVEAQRGKELAELAEARDRAERAAAQIRHLRKARLAYAAAGAVFLLLGVAMALLGRSYYKTSKSYLEASEKLRETHAGWLAEKDRVIEANQKLKESVEETKKANEAAEQVIDRVTSGVLQEIGAKDGAQIATLQRVISAGLVAFDNIPPQVAKAARLRLNRAKLLRASAEAFIAQGLHAHFAEAKKSAEAAAEALAGLPQDPPVAEARSEILLTLGDIHARRGHEAPEATAGTEIDSLFNRADSYYNQALELARIPGGDAEVARMQQARCLVKLGTVIESRWRRVRAVEGTQIAAKRQLLQNELAKYSEALEIASTLPATKPEVRLLLADIYNRTGTAYALLTYQRSDERQNYFTKAETNFTRALDLRRQLLNEDRASVARKRLVAYTTNNIGWLYEIKLLDERWATKTEQEVLARKVEQAYKDRLALALEVADTDPQNFSYRKDLAGAYVHLAALYRSRPTLIQNAQQKSLEFYQKAVEVTHHEAADELENLEKAAVAFRRPDVAARAREDLAKLKSLPLPTESQEPRGEERRD